MIIDETKNTINFLAGSPATVATVASSTSSSSHKAHSTSLAALCLRMSASAIMLACLIVTLVDPYSPRLEIKNKVATTTATSSSSSRMNNNVKYSTQEAAKGRLNPIVNRAADAVRIVKKPNYEPLDLILPKLPTLLAALDSSDVVALYFGASWCKMSKPVTTMIDESLGPKLKQYASLSSKATTDQHPRPRRPFSLIYVSSDASKSQYRNYNKNRFWTKVPFQSKPKVPSERKALKAFFKVCAKRELEKLHIQRQHEIPYIVILSGDSHKIVSQKGVHELKLWGPAVVDYWADLVRRANEKTATLRADLSK